MLLKKANIRHMITSVATITRCRDIVMVGSGALIATAKTLPAELMITAEADVYVRDAADAADIQNLIEGTLGEGSQFQKTFKYYVDAVSDTTAVLPRSWEERAIKLTIIADPPTVLTCPAPNDLAISKCVAWREKDQDWLKACARYGLIDVDRMIELVSELASVDLDGLDLEQVLVRIDYIRPPTLPNHTARGAPRQRPLPKKPGSKS